MSRIRISRVVANVANNSVLTVSANNIVGTILTTSNISEGSNLYFTNARVYANVIELGYATSTYVDNKVANLVNSAPAALDTLFELANALGNDASFATTVTNQLSSKANSTDLTTANVFELTNLYFTNARSIAALTAGTGIAIESNGLITSTAVGGVQSVNGANGAVVLTTANIAESGNLYYTNTRSRAAISVTGTGGSYDSATGIITLTSATSGSTTITANINTFTYVATNNQTVFTGADKYGETLVLVEPNKSYVYLNGILLLKTDDYTAYTSNVTLSSPVSANSIITIVDSLVTITEPSASVARYSYTASNNQTIFSGIDDNGLTLSLNDPGSIYVYLNGILLTKTNDYNAYLSNVTLVSGATANSTITIVDGLFYSLNSVTSVNGANGTVVLTTSNIAEGSNLYYTNARVRSAITAGNTLSYDSSTGNITMSVSGVTAGTYGNANTIAVVTVDTFGRVTNVSNVAITASGTSITVTNDTSNTSSLYPAFLNVTTGTATSLYTSNNKLLYKPSTGELTSTVQIAQNGIFINSSNIALDYTIAQGYNGMSAGPITVNTGVNVTISSGSVWTIV